MNLIGNSFSMNLIGNSLSYNTCTCMRYGDSQCVVRRLLGICESIHEGLRWSVTVHSLFWQIPVDFSPQTPAQIERLNFEHI